MKKYIAEALGTWALTLIVGLSITGLFPVATPILVALTVGVFVYTIGHISGTHLNPAVTIGLWSIKKINANDALAYIVSQFLGAGVAYAMLSAFSHSPSLIVMGNVGTGFAEMLGAFFLTFGIASVVFGKTPHDASGLVIGGSLLLGIAVSAIMGANGVLNPAVAFGIGSLGIMYIVGPIVGSVLGMQAYKHLQ